MIVDELVPVVQLLHLVFVHTGRHAAGMRRRREPMHTQGSGKHGVADLAILVVDDQCAIRGLTIAQTLDVALLALGNAVEQDRLRFPELEPSDTPTLYAVTLNGAVARGEIEKILLRDDALVADELLLLFSKGTL